MVTGKIIVLYDNEERLKQAESKLNELKKISDRVNQGVLKINRKGILDNLRMAKEMKGAVGDDEKADFVLSTLEKFGVDTIGFERLKGVPTSSTILNIRPNGERPALHLRGACDYFLPPEKEIQAGVGIL